MGLLDDAIREHLELKRRRGADPGEVAREQREALDTPHQPLAERPADDEISATPGAEGALAAEPLAQTADELDRTLAADADAQGPPAIAGDDDLIAGETAELDMSTVLSPGAGEDGAGAEEDPWLPDDAVEEEQPPEPAPSGEAEGEDVLEETPEFLQETPEHDRLWFEQKPPRDFDWDK